MRLGVQAALLDSLYGTERGLSARSEVRAEINELISQLESRNPTPSPTEVRGAGITNHHCVNAWTGCVNAWTGCVECMDHQACMGGR